MMIWRNTPDSYGIVAKGFHWIIALLVVGLIGVGLYMTGRDPSPQLFATYAFHKSIGITVLFLVVLRLVWRVSNPHPAPLPNHRRWEKMLARVIHGLLYLALFVMPLSGWIMSSAKGFSVSVFNLFTLPDFVPRDDGLAALAGEVHEIAAWTLIAMIGLHFAGALKHHIVDRDATLRRMLPALAVFAVVSGVAVIPAAYADNAVSQWSIIPAEGTLSFEGQQMGAPFTGRFPEFSGQIAFDPDRLDESRADITIAIAGLDAGSSDRNRYLPMDDWFAAARFPTARFVTEKITPGLSRGQYVARGQLTIRDVTLPVTLPFTLDITSGENGGEVAHMRGETTLNRLDFGIGQGEWADTKSVAAEVRVRVDLRAVRKDAASRQ